MLADFRHNITVQQKENGFMELRHPHSSFPCAPALIADESTTQNPDAKNSHMGVSGLEAIACELLTYFSC